MGQLLNFRIEQTWDDKTQFTDDPITITVDGFSVSNGKHRIANPPKANAQFICCGRFYMVTNANAIPTVEDWYLQELLPKVQMLTLLESPSAI